MERPLRIVIAARSPMCFLCDLFLEFPIWARCLTDTYEVTIILYTTFKSLPLTAL
jgi:hypothetical protein